MLERSTNPEGAGALPVSAVLPGRAWRRIIIVSATISALISGLSSAAAQGFAAKAPPPHHDQLVKFEKAGCRELQAFPKHGWLCTR